MFPTSTTLSLPLDAVATLGFYLVAGSFCIFSAILYYHWQEYSSDVKMTSRTLLLYFGTSIPLLILMGILAVIVL